MSEEELPRYRYNMAKEKLDAATSLLENGFYKDSISRSYYAIFTAARAILSLEQKDSAKHSGIISLFNRYFIKTKLLDKKFSKILTKAKLYREMGDYGDFSIVSMEEAEEQIKNAGEFLSETEKHIYKKT